MCRTARRNLDSFRVGVGGAAAIVLLAACGGGSSEAGAPELTAAGVTEFCSQAAEIDERVDAALSGVEGDPSLTGAFRAIADDLRAIEAPAAIASDWNAMAAGLDRMADAFGQVDVTDLDSLEVLEQAEGDLTAVSDNVNQYLGDECGL